jgi:hypothetical protein
MSLPSSNKGKPKTKYQPPSSAASTSASELDARSDARMKADGVRKPKPKLKRGPQGDANDVIVVDSEEEREFISRAVR